MSIIHIEKNETLELTGEIEAESIHNEGTLIIKDCNLKTESIMNHGFLKIHPRTHIIFSDLGDIDLQEDPNMLERGLVSHGPCHIIGEEVDKVWTGNIDDGYKIYEDFSIKIESENQENPERFGHTMFMHPDTVIRNVHFDHLGKTDKKRPITDKWTQYQNRNKRGRYSVHFHRVGTDPKQPPCIVEKCLVTNSPGWGIVNHSSNILVLDCAVRNAVGSAFVGETGNEIGEFVNCYAENMEGSGEVIDKRQMLTEDDGSIIEKSSSNPNQEPTIKNDDLGHSGHGFFMTGPLIELENCHVNNARHVGAVMWSRGLVELDLGDDPEIHGFASTPKVLKENTVEFKHGIDLPDLVESERIAIKHVKNIFISNSGGGFEVSRHKMSNKKYGDIEDNIDNIVIKNIIPFVDKFGKTPEKQKDQYGNTGLVLRYNNDVTIGNITIQDSKDPKYESIRMNTENTNIQLKSLTTLDP